MGCFLLVMAALLIGMVFVHDFVNPGWLLWLECPGARPAQPLGRPSAAGCGWNALGHAPARIGWNRSSRIET